MRSVPPQPFLKWVGGKRALLDQIRPFVSAWREENPKGRYFEPFIGAGAVFFDLDPSVKKYGNDFNADLIEVYEVIRDNPKGLLRELKKHVNTPEHFYEVRGWDRRPNFQNRSPVSRAARFIYLNRTCFNGLYRVNRSGYFNVPFGNYKSPNYLNPENILSVSEFLNLNPKPKFYSGDYRKCTSNARQGDFVYLDPPYDPISNTSSFTSYSNEGFGKDDQKDLRDEALRLTEIGATVLLSNSDTEFVRDIYSISNKFQIVSVKIHRGVGASAASRGITNELLIRNLEAK